MGNRNNTDPLDLDTFAYDLADLFDTHRYPIPERIGPDEIRAALPALLAALGLTPVSPEPSVPADTKHTCNPHRPGHPRPFGRPAPAGECARCDELRAGAPRREVPSWVQVADINRRYEAQLDADRRAHFAPGGPHGQCGPACTAFDW